jgi:hypothetical protein
MSQVTRESIFDADLILLGKRISRAAYDTDRIGQQRRFLRQFQAFSDEFFFCPMQFCCKLGNEIKNLVLNHFASCLPDAPGAQAYFRNWV